MNYSSKERLSISISKYKILFCICRHFEGANAVPTLAKNVGSLCLFYFPLTTLSIYEYISNESYDTIASKCCLIFLMLSPISNCIIFGFGNKVIKCSYNYQCNYTKLIYSQKIVIYERKIC